MESLIEDVSDTALWVAHYRAKESSRPDALFRDPFAERLTGERGRRIALSTPDIGKHVAWSVTIRTVIIDDYIQRLIAKGVDTVLNLGAGLDSRPYRMNLPDSLRWIEVDHPHLIDYKAKLLADEKPRCELEMVRLDLADRQKRQSWLADVAQRSKNVLVLTEGVIPYLSEGQVAELAEDLHAHRSFKYWVTEYYSSEIYKYLRDSRRAQYMKKAPFRFFPADWFAFFKKHGWAPTEKQFLGDWGEELHRRMPLPWWAFLFWVMRPFMSKEKFYRFRKLNAYVLFEPIP